jgi:predicted nicotinamide N-methyase
MFKTRFRFLYRMEFQTQIEHLQFGTVSVELMTIENFDALFDALIAKGDDHPDVVDERIPYWADLWASALGLSEYLVDNQEVIQDKTVLEIGCGLGLPAIIAAKLGAKQVHLTDYLPEAVDFSRLNFEKNLSIDPQTPPSVKSHFSTLDWRKPTPQYAADVLLAADVAYEKRAFAPLLNAFKILLKPNGLILIAEPNRPVSTLFFANLNKHGYTVSQKKLTVVRRGQPFIVNIFALRLTK